MTLKGSRIDGTPGGTAVGPSSSKIPIILITLRNHTSFCVNGGKIQERNLVIIPMQPRLPLRAVENLILFQEPSTPSSTVRDMQVL